MKDGCFQRFSRHDNMMQQCVDLSSRHDLTHFSYRTHMPGTSRAAKGRKAASGPQRNGSKKRARRGSVSDESYESSDGAASPPPMSPKARSRELPRGSRDDSDDAYTPATSERPRRTVVPTSRALAARAHSFDFSALASSKPVVRPTPVHAPSAGATHTLANALDVVHLQSPVIQHTPLPLSVRQRPPSPTVSRSSSFGSTLPMAPTLRQVNAPTPYSFDPRAAIHHQQQPRALTPFYTSPHTQLPAYQPPPSASHSGGSSLAAAALYAEQAANRPLPPPVQPVDALAAYRAMLASHHAQHAGPGDGALMDDDGPSPPWLL